MAVVVAWRLAIWLAPHALRSVQSGQPAWGGAGLYVSDQIHRRLFDPDESDAQLSQDLSDDNDTVVDVATFNAPFELRKVQIAWSQKDAVVAQDDDRVVTIHLIKTVAGAPTDQWVAADFNAAVAAIDAFWNSLLTYYKLHTVLKRIAFYKAGPDISPPQPPVFSVDRAIQGTSGATAILPPQAAITVTEMAGTKPHWGRFYMPASASTMTTEYGRITTAFQTALADAADTMYQAFKTANIPAVVYRPALPVRQTAEEKRNNVSPGSLPARTASAWTVDKLQVDDIFDVIRSRRWKVPTLRVQRDIT